MQNEQDLFRTLGESADAGYPPRNTAPREQPRVNPAAQAQPTRPPNRARGRGFVRMQTIVRRLFAAVLYLMSVAGTLVTCVMLLDYRAPGYPLGNSALALQAVQEGNVSGTAVFAMIFVQGFASALQISYSQDHRSWWYRIPLLVSASMSLGGFLATIGRTAADIVMNAIPNGFLAGTIATIVSLGVAYAADLIPEVTLRDYLESR